MGILEVESILEKIKEIHQKKNTDYAAEGKQFENFERSAELISWFSSDEDKTFVNLIGTKLARLATLLNKNGEPLNESIDDSFLDLCTYSILWWGYHQRINKKEGYLYLDLNKNKYCYADGTVVEKSGSGVVTRVESEQRYRCDYCGIRFTHTPHTRHLVIIDLHFDSLICLEGWAKEHPIVPTV